MEKDNSIKNQSILNIYCKEIFDFEQYLEQIYKKGNSMTNYEGYLIDIKDYDELKKSIDYNHFKANITKHNLDKKILFETEKTYEIKQIYFKTSSYLLNMIDNGNKYILINKDLWNIICEKGKENDSPIIYDIKDKMILFELDDNKKLSFIQNQKSKNIIDKIGYKGEYKSNIDKIKIIYKDIKLYYDFENKFLNDLKKSKPATYGYLIAKNSFDKWTKYSNYEYIKKEFLEKNIKDEKSIKNKIIYYQENYKYNYSELEQIEIKNFKTEKEINSFLKNNSLIIINSLSFIINNSTKNNFTKYSLHEQKIELFLENRITFESNNNIISKNEYITNLECLIEIFYFNEYLNKQLRSPPLKTSIKEDNNIYLISKDVINQFKKHFEYDLLGVGERKKYLKNYEKIKMDDYSQLIKNFGDRFINNFKKKNQFFKITNKNNFCGLNIIVKEVNYPTGKIINYITDFEIINENIKSFFIKNNIVKEFQIISGFYYSEINKIAIGFTLDEKYIYEIANFKSKGNDNEFIIEYYIEAIDNETNDILIKYFVQEGINKLISNYFKNNEIIIDKKKLIGYYYEIKNNKINDNKNLIKNDNTKKLNNLEESKKETNNYKSTKNVNIYKNLNYKKSNSGDIKNKEEKEIESTSKENKVKNFDKLKTIILLAINNIIINYEANKNNNYEKVFLINKNALKTYQNEILAIKNFIIQDSKNIEKIMNNNVSLDLFIDDIISKYDQKSLKMIDEKFVNQKKILDISSYLIIEKAKLINKNINIYKDFIILSNYIYKDIKSNLDYFINKQNINYLSKDNKDIITIELDSQNTILIGNINKENNIYQILYILDFESNKYLKEVKDQLLECNIDNYIENNMILIKREKMIIYLQLFLIII